MRKCLTVDTLVRTSEGPKKVSELQVGDVLYDPSNLPVQCVAVGDVQTGQLKKVTYRQFNAGVKTETSFKCTPDHLLTLVANAVPPQVSGRHLAWYTRCNRTELEHEIEDLTWDDAAAVLYSDLVDEVADQPDQDLVHDYVDSVVNDHFHQGNSKFGSLIDRAVQKLAVDDLEDHQELVRNALHDAIETHHNEMLRNEAGINEQSSDVDDESDDEMDDVQSCTDDDLEVYDLDLPSDSSFHEPASTQNSQRTIPDSQGSQQTVNDSQASTLTYATESYQYVNAMNAERFSRLKSSLNTGHSCSGFRRVHRTMASNAQAELARSVLASEHHHLIDPYIVRDGDILEVTPDEYLDICCKASKKTNIRLYRAPLAFEPVGSNSAASSVPIDPYWLGFWLGDGNKNRTSLISSDLEIKVFVHDYVRRLNERRPAGKKPLKVTERKGQRASDFMPALGYTANVDVFHYDIVNSVDSPGVVWNPVKDALKEYGLLGDKSGGIPNDYMTADEETRLKVIAGLIESDGSYIKDSNVYQFAQMGEQHKKIVDDLKTLANSCGIETRGPFVRDTSNDRVHNKNGAQDYYYMYLGRGSAKFQPHLYMPRKRMVVKDRKFHNTDIRPILRVEDSEAGQYRAVQVAGGVFQLENRLVVHNCHLNTCEY